MANPEWGLKRICPNCGTRYYDFSKSPPTCPNCGTVYDPEALLRSRRTRPGAVVEEPRKAAPVVGKDDAEPLDEELEDETVDVPDAEEAEDDPVADALIEDADEIDDEEIDVAVEDGDENE